MRILVVDDHELLRDGVRRLIARQPDMEVVGETADGRTAVTLAKELRPDIVLMDVFLPGLDGAAATSMITQECPGIRVLAYSGDSSRAVLESMRRAGATGFVRKDEDPNAVLRLLRQVFRDEVDFGLAGTSQEPTVGPAPVTDLSGREEQVMHLLAEGFIAKEIADQLRISPKSVETYKARLMDKLGFKSRVELIAYVRAKRRTEPS